MTPANDIEAGRYGQNEGAVHPDDPIDEQSHLRIGGFDEDSSPSTPRFLQDERSYRHRRWIPPSVRRINKRVVVWAKGPQPPQIQSIEPWFPMVQEFPIKLKEQFVPKRSGKIILLLIFYFAWILTFGLVLRASTFASEVEGYGEPVGLGCGNTFWPKDGCGLNGNDCRPFNGSAFAFSCPANCASYKTLNPRAVGAQEINYRPVIIGGPVSDEPHAQPIYRGDSFICGSAIHAGVIDNGVGGCGVLSTIGQSTNYASTKRNNILSIAFDSSFPLSFTFHEGIECDSKDLRWPLLGISMTFTILLSLLTTSPAVFFFSIFTGIFAHTGFASDPPGHVGLADLLSNLLGKFLPAAFCAFVIYKYCARKTLEGLTAQIEKTIFWLGSCWVGALSNYTFDWIPIQRLNAHDLNQQPGAKLALAIIIIILICIVAQQIYYFRLEGRLPRYLALYSIFVASILISLALPNLNLRIHHYVLALLLLPGTSMQTRPVLIYQGLLVGLFINGIARWGFDPILQTEWALQGDAQHNSLLPIIMDPIVSLGLSAQTISFTWTIPPWPMDGISVMVNDVERFRGYVDEGLGSDKEFTWSRDGAAAESQYFRFAYLQGAQKWDYTKAGTWLSDGSWRKMEPGPSKLRSRGLGGESSEMKI
ncbi:MAG: hypothetical protein M1818_002357 [Claussenomyces sp. TS43310]|nr:MAG: hypothetical protein M1818_002357 [Claussenomyces sp. TS43310]